jgi:hypothetical protein
VYEPQHMASKGFSECLAGVTYHAEMAQGQS